MIEYDIDLTLRSLKILMVDVDGLKLEISVCFNA